MLVKFKTVFSDKCHVPRNSIVEVEYCCEEMSRLFSADREGYPFTFAISGKPTAILVHKTPYWQDGDEISGYKPIAFCPFCGEAITTLEVARVRQISERRTEMVEKTDIVSREVPIDE